MFHEKTSKNGQNPDLGVILLLDSQILYWTQRSTSLSEKRIEVGVLKVGLSNKGCLGGELTNPYWIGFYIKC